MVTKTVTLALSPLILVWASTARAVTFDWVNVSNAGNLADTEVMVDGTTGYGSVAYNYRIGKTEVTNAQYAEFLNAVASSDTHGLYNISMGLDPRGGIVRSGVDGSYSYDVKSDALGGTYIYSDQPVIFVSYFDAMRFVNWLQNGQPSGAQGLGTTEDGVYTISDGISEQRLASARYFLPSEDEWYKAAYHKNDGLTGNFWDYPTSSDSIPNNNQPESDTGNSANYFTIDYTNGSAVHPLTEVAAYALSGSPYGTFDQGGNVLEWNEAVKNSLVRGIRGGYYGTEFNFLAASWRGFELPDAELAGIGFRIASIPEPSTSLLAAVAGLILLGRRKRQVNASISANEWVVVAGGAIGPAELKRPYAVGTSCFQ